MRIFLSAIFISAVTAVVGQPLVGPNRSIDPYHYTIQKNAVFTHGSVACAHPLAAQVGAAMLKKGGNAFDAAIATQLALAVVYPGAGNIGGGGFLVARRGKQNIALDFRETAPAAASRNMYVDSNGVANTNLSQLGHLASGIPGTVKGLFATLPYAKLAFKTLIEPAITLAEKGFVITEGLASQLNGSRDAFIKYNSKPPVFVKASNWKAGDTLVQKDLAATLRRIRDFGAAGFYKGKTAQLIVAEMQRGKGLINANDLAYYQVKKRRALQFNYQGYTIVSMPPPSSGGLLLWQMLKMVEPFPLQSYGFETAKSVHLMTEAERRAYADRAQHMGDPDFWSVPVSTLTSNAYLKKRMASYDSLQASTSAGIAAGQIESLETTHISIVDRFGNMVSVTTTLNGGFGSKTVVQGAGFLLNNEMDDFSIKPGVPNMYGAVGGEANAIAPGKRMLSSMTPTVVIKGSKPFLVVGTPGGTTIPTSVFQVIVNLVDFNMNLNDAINKPRFHHQWFPDYIQVEPGFPEQVAQQLQSMKHVVKTYGIANYATTIGRVEAIQLKDGRRYATADARGEDSVAGY